MQAVWGYEGEEGDDAWGDGRGVTLRMYATEAAHENGYMRGEWGEVGRRLEAHPATQERVRAVYKIYRNRAALQADRTMNRRVLAAVREAHRLDEATVEEVMGETDEDRARMGEIAYMVTLEEPEQEGHGGGEDGRVGGGGVGGRGGMYWTVDEGRGGGVGTTTGNGDETLSARWGEQYRVIAAEAAEWRLSVGGHLREVVGGGMTERWRWGRVPMAAGRGWLVTYQHGARGEIGQAADVEARAAVMAGQWGWAVYAVQECKAGQRVGWYEGERVRDGEWEGLGWRERREHTVRAGHTAGRTG